MVLTTKVAKDLNLIIDNTLFDYGVDRMLENIEAYRKRNRITNEEAEYLKAKVEAKMDESVNAELKKINK
ncbi:hypothetical protein [Clostridium sp.]|uniref:hypothetical protein n=1 Tax=Clostridium sp. TaxID=1506 RepID=UPI003F30F0C8